VLVGPSRSRTLPASVGLKVSSCSAPSTSRFEALCSCRPWSSESRNSRPSQVSEWIAPATREVVMITISEPPAGARMTASPETASATTDRPGSDPRSAASNSTGRESMTRVYPGTPGRPPVNGREYRR